MLHERRAKRAGFERMKRLSMPRGLAWEPHARKLDHARPEREERHSSEVARWNRGMWHDRSTLVHYAIEVTLGLAYNFCRALSKGAISRFSALDTFKNL